MAERIITDGNGDRWDVRQDGEEGTLLFRHQSGRRVTLEAERPLDALENEDLLTLLAESGRAGDIRDEGSARQPADAEGYVTRPDAPDRPAVEEPPGGAARR